MLKLLIIALSICLVPACNSNNETNDNTVSDEKEPSIKLYALDCGSIIMQANAFDSADSFPDDELRYLVVPCYLIRHPKGDFMWDAGLPDAMHETPTIAPMLRAWVERPMADQLNEIGVPPEDVEYLSVSHSHFDHAGNAAQFVNASLIVMPQELSFSSSVLAKESGGVIFDITNDQVDKIIIDGEHDVFGDGSVIVFPTPGHTAGHLSMILKLPKSGNFAFTGDLYHLEESRERQLVPDFNFDPDQTRASMETFEAMVETHNATPILQHVRSDFERFPRFPEYAE